MKMASLFLLAVASASLWQRGDSAFHDDFNIPVTVQVPSGHENDTLRLHLAAYGAVPYGESMDSTRVVHYPRDCLCGGKRCFTGCGDLRLASPRCRRRLHTTEHNVFVFEETDGDRDDGCSRAERAYNAAKVGARSLVIIGAPNATDLVTAIDSQAVSAAVETLQFLEHVAMPIGIMAHSDGQKLMGYVREGEKAGLVPKVKLDFKHEQQGEVVHVYVWHDTDDDCGVLCHDVHAFFADLATIQENLPPGGPLKIVPRFLFENCTSADSGSDLCQRGCINGGKYCTLRGSRSAQAPGAMVAQENVRQACLYHAMRDNPRNVRQFWKYKVNFQNNCKSADGNFNAECSAEQFAKLSLGNAAAVTARLENCTAALNNGDSSIPVADADVAGQAAQGVSTFQQATIVTAIPKPDRSHHYKGDLSAVHVMKAACSALKPVARKQVPQCAHLSKGACRPGGDGDTACKSQTNRNKRTTQCVEVAAPLGYECRCAAGYVNLPDVDGGQQCVDRNECSEFPALCGRLSNARNACQNLEGSFECKADLEQQCSPERQFGGCWSGEIEGRTYNSCEDLVAAAVYNLQEGLEQGPLSQCNCGSMPGCWEGGDGECRQKCPTDRCDFGTGQCDSGPPPLSTGGVVGVSFAVVIAVAVAAAIAFLIFRRRHVNHDPATAAVMSKYGSGPYRGDGSSVAAYVAGAEESTGALGGSHVLRAAVVQPTNGSAADERPPTFAAQNSFVGALTVADHEQESAPLPPPQ